MIIGNGLLARAFMPHDLGGATIFASGVSNSAETDPLAFRRESDLLDLSLQNARDRFVYFSTTSILDPERQDSGYVAHKRAMEAKVLASSDHLVLRLPQVVGRTRNPHTLTNFLAAKISAGEQFSVWRQATRCLLDVDDVALLTRYLLANGFRLEGAGALVSPEVLDMPTLVGLMEQTLCLPAKCTFLPSGGGARVDPALAMSVASAAGVDFNPGYSQRVLQKYYGKKNAD